MRLFAKPTIEEAVKKFLEDRAKHYDDGSGPSRELSNLRTGLRPVVEAIGSMKIRDLNAPALADLRDRWIEEAKVGRAYINKRLQYVGRLIRWGIERGLTTNEQLVGILAVERIKRGRYGARDSDPIRPANRDDVEAVLADPLLSPAICSMMRLVQLTGMRPGEARTMKLADLERLQHNGETVFRYSIRKHKTAHHGKRRRVFLTGQAYRIVVERISTLAKDSLFEQDSEGYLFSPDGSGSKPYSDSSIPQAIRRACSRVGVKRWTPNQLRHGFATETRAKGYQLDLIADLLGHADPRTTLIYAEPDDGAALEAMLRLAV